MKRKYSIEFACYAMFNLNRFAKHRQCDYHLKQKIYNNKNKLIKNLYENNFSSDVLIQIKDNNYKLYVFIFNVFGKKYSWHMPINRCNFVVKLTNYNEYSFEMFEKPVYMSRSDMVDALRILKEINDNFTNYL